MVTTNSRWFPFSFNGGTMEVFQPDDSTGIIVPLPTTLSNSLVTVLNHMRLVYASRKLAVPWYVCFLGEFLSVLWPLSVVRADIWLKYRRKKLVHKETRTFCNLGLFNPSIGGPYSLAGKKYWHIYVLSFIVTSCSFYGMCYFLITFRLGVISVFWSS